MNPNEIPDEVILTWLQLDGWMERMSIKYLCICNRRRGIVVYRDAGDHVIISHPYPDFFDVAVKARHRELPRDVLLRLGRVAYDKVNR